MADDLLSLANAVKRRPRRERLAYNRDLPGEQSSERLRQVAAVLDRPEERRNPTRFVPDYTGVTALSRTEFKTDQREIEKSGSGNIPHPEDDDHDGGSPYKIDLSLPVPPVMDDGEARYKRFKRWSKDHKDIDLDLARYRATIDLVRNELRRMENRGEQDEDRFLAMRLYFLDYLHFLRAEKQWTDTSLTRLESLCEQEAEIVSKRKGRHKGMKEVMQRVKQHGKRMRELLHRERNLSERLSKLEQASDSTTGEYILPDGDRTVMTTVGRGTLEKERRDGVLVVRLPFGVGYFSRTQVMVHGKEGPGLGDGTDTQLTSRWTLLSHKLGLEDEEVALGMQGKERVLHGDSMEVGGEGGGAALRDMRQDEDTSTLVPVTQGLLPLAKPSELLVAPILDLLARPLSEGFQAFQGRLPTDLEAKWEADKAEMAKLEERKQELCQAVRSADERRRMVWDEFLTYNAEKLQHASKLFKLRSRVADIKGAHRQLLLKHGFANGRLPPNLRAVVQHQLAAKGIVGQRTAALLQQQQLQQQMQQIQAAAAAAAAPIDSAPTGMSSPAPNSEGGEQEGSARKGEAGGGKLRESDDEGHDGKGKRRATAAKGARGNGKLAPGRGETPTPSVSTSLSSAGQLHPVNTSGVAAKRRAHDEGGGVASGTPSTSGTPTGGEGDDERRGGGVKKARKGRGK